MDTMRNESTPMMRTLALLSLDAKKEQPTPNASASDRLTVQFDCNPLMALAWDAVQRGYLGAMS